MALLFTNVCGFYGSVFHNEHTVKRYNTKNKQIKLTIWMQQCAVAR